MAKKKRKNSTAQMDKRIARIAGILTIVVSIIVIAGVLVVPLVQNTTVQNETGTEIEAVVIAYADGVYYEGSSPVNLGLPNFDDATVSGTVTFYIAILEGNVDGLTLQVVKDGETEPISTESATSSSLSVASVSFDYEINYDTTQLENGVYWFDVLADLSDDTIPYDGGDPGQYDVPLSTFGFSQSEEGGSGTDVTDTDGVNMTGFVIPGLIIVGIVFVVIVAVVFMKR